MSTVHCARVPARRFAMMHDEEEHFDEEIEITNVREDDEEKLYISPSQHKKMLEEINRLKTKERLRIAERIKDAKGFGDLSENAEYEEAKNCLLYTSDAADDLLCVDLGGRRIIKKKKKTILK